MEVIINMGKRKTSLSTPNLILLSFLSGIFISLGAVGSQMAGNKVIGACVFPIGLIMTVFFGAELFTGNNLIITSVLAKEVKVKMMLKNLIIVYFGNMAGAFLIALMAYPFITDYTAAIAKTSLSYPHMFTKAILCNFLVCMAVYLGINAKNEVMKVIGLFLPTMLFVLCGFEHCVANMYFIPLGILGGADVSIPAYLVNLLFVTAGNLVGGMGLGICIWAKKA